MTNMNRTRNWSFAAILTLPILLFFLCNIFNHKEGLVATGFIQYDNATYAGNAYQYNWREHGSPLYSNRLNDSHNYPNIYFNPQLFALAALMRMGLLPGYALMLFTLICAFFLFRIVIGLYDELKTCDEYRNRNIVLLSWGGGLLCAAGFFLYAIGVIKRDLWSALFFLDPAQGWWGLNLGRSLFFSLEAWYHLLFFGTIFSLITKKWIAAGILLLALSLSHPFTGIELLVIVFTWTIVEKLFIRKFDLPNYFIVFLVLLLGLHLWYYLIFLNRYPEHLAVFNQYSLNWKYRFYHFLPAYVLAGALLILSARIQRWKFFLESANNRLFLCWAVVAFALANHEVFLRPMQPLHFTRGYVWSAVMLAGLPGLNSIWKFLSRQKWGIIFSFLFLVVFLSDNFLWIWANSRRVNEVTGVTIITDEQESLISAIKKQATYNDLIIGTDEVLPYLCSVYTKSSVWISHPYNTPFYSKKKSLYLTFIQTTELPNEWRGRRLIFIINKSDEDQVERFKQITPGVMPVVESLHYLVYELER
jgi:hypothetical protein